MNITEERSSYTKEGHRCLHNLGENMNITITVNKDDLIQTIADALRYNALMAGGVENWTYYNDALADGLEDYLAEDGDYSTPYEYLAVKFVEKEFE